MSLHRPRKPHAVPVRPADRPPPPLVFVGTVTTTQVIAITAAEARQIARVLDSAREWPAVGDIFSGASQDPAILRQNIATSKALLDTALDALPPALLARLRDAAGTGTEAAK